MDGDKTNYMFHCMTVKIPVRGTISSWRMTFTNETTGFYYGMGEKAASINLPFMEHKVGCKVELWKSSNS